MVLPDQAPAVLLVDDDLVHRHLIRSLLEEVFAQRPVALADAADGEEALRLLERLVGAHDRVLMLTDQSMPGLDGDQVIAEARRRFPDAPVRYVLWSSVHPDLAKAAKASPGPDQVAEKPGTLEAFLALVASVVRSWDETARLPSPRVA